MLEIIIVGDCYVREDTTLVQAVVYHRVYYSPWGVGRVRPTRCTSFGAAIVPIISHSNGTLAIEQIDQGQATSYDICRLVVALFDLSYAAGDFDPSGPPMGLVWCPFKKVVDYYHDGFTELQYRSLNLYDAAMMLASAIKIVQQ